MVCCSVFLTFAPLCFGSTIGAGTTTAGSVISTVVFVAGGCLSASVHAGVVPGAGRKRKTNTSRITPSLPGPRRTTYGVMGSSTICPM